jgi:hypothetical protein
MSPELKLDLDVYACIQSAIKRRYSGRWQLANCWQRRSIPSSQELELLIKFSTNNFSKRMLPRFWVVTNRRGMDWMVVFIDSTRNYM